MDPRLGRWLSKDPLQQKYPEESPYIFSGNSPIVLIDVNGLYKFIVHMQYDANTGKYTILKVERQNGLKSKTRTISKATCGNCGSILVDQNDWYDYASFKVTVINGKPNTAYNVSKPDQIVGNVKTTTDWDIEWYAKTKVSDGKGGVIFTSKYGQNGADEADFPDGKIENIDKLMDVIGAVGAVGNLEIFGRAVQKAFLNKNGYEIAELVLKLTKSSIKDEINDAKKEATKKDEDVLPAGSDSCTICNKVEPKDSMNNHDDKSQNYHGGKTQTKSDNKVKN